MCLKVQYREEKVRADGAHVQGDLRLIKLKIQSVVSQRRHNEGGSVLGSCDWQFWKEMAAWCSPRTVELCAALCGRKPKTWPIISSQDCVKAGSDRALTNPRPSQDQDLSSLDIRAPETRSMASLTERFESGCQETCLPTLACPGLPRP